MGTSKQTGRRYWSSFLPCRTKVLYEPPPPLVRETLLRKSQSPLLADRPLCSPDSRQSRSYSSRPRAKIWPNLAPPIHPPNLRALQSVARAANRALRRVRCVALAERRTFLETLRERIALRTKATQTSREAALKNVTRQLQDTHRFSRIKRAIDPIRQPPLTKVELVHASAHLHPTTGEWVSHRKVHTVNTRQELEDCIIARNKRHFAQADGTPFTQAPLSFISSTNNFNLYQDAQGSPLKSLMTVLPRPTRY
jgi:hypothetical protein